ncbi:MAG: hypothetical protein KC493_05350 [Bacteriovoracaceae bacterium]|nr:hypothetical protein [Bacteriovoracaceae bacterium]
MFSLGITIFVFGASSVFGRELFTPMDKLKLKELKSKEYTEMNFNKEMKRQNHLRLSFILKKMSSNQKELLDHQLKNDPWVKMDEQDTKFYMNKWISKVLLKPEKDKDYE